LEKDSHIIEIFKLLDAQEAIVTLCDGRVLKVWNIVWGYDESDDFAHITTNISPTKEGTSIDSFYTNEIKTIANNGGQIFSSDEKLKPINLIFLRTGKLILTKRKYYHWRQIQSQYEDYMASIDFDTLELLIAYIKIEYNMLENDIINELDKKQFVENETIKFELKNSL